LGAPGRCSSLYAATVFDLGRIDASLLGHLEHQLFQCLAILRRGVLTIQPEVDVIALLEPTDIARDHQLEYLTRRFRQLLVGVAASGGIDALGATLDGLVDLPADILLRALGHGARDGDAIRTHLLVGPLLRLHLFDVTRRSALMAMPKMGVRAFMQKDV